MHFITDDQTDYAFSALIQSTPKRWLTRVLIVPVGVFVLLTSVVIFYCKKKRRYRGTERKLLILESELHSVYVMRLGIPVPRIFGALKPENDKFSF